MHNNHNHCASAPAASEPLTFLEDLRSATELLEAIAANRELLRDVPADQRERLHRAIAEAYLPDPKARRLRVQAAARERVAARAERAEAVLGETGIRTLRRKIEFTTPNVFAPENFEPDDREAPAEVDPQHCYVCKQKSTTLHHFYDQMCPACAEFNFAKRTELADLRGRVALVTGGRVKIGYQAGLKLLRAGAQLIVTTRFPRDSARALRARAGLRASGATGWRSSASICGTRRASRRSAGSCSTPRDRLDFIINNACQTVRRPPGFYAHMMEGETRRRARARMPAEARRACSGVCDERGRQRCVARDRRGLTRSAELSQVPLLAEDSSRQEHLFPARPARSGSAAGRSARAQLVAPAAGRGAVRRAARGATGQRGRAVHLNARLKPLMLRTPGARQAHRQRVGDGRPVLPALQDDTPSAHEHGEGRAQHDDPHLGGRLRQPTAST